MSFTDYIPVILSLKDRNDGTALSNSPLRADDSKWSRPTPDKFTSIEKKLDIY